MTQYTLTINDEIFEVQIGAIQGDTAQVFVNQMPYEVKINGGGSVPFATGAAPSTVSAVPIAAQNPVLCAIAGSGVVAAPIPGKMLQINVKVGDRVKNGQVVAIMEAMKMENNILSPMDGKVKEIKAPVGTDVNTNDVIMVIV
ncbi:MAG: biotin/lipoyl-binding protein [Desulfobacteraceae bacterium]|nr:biotin/lipoyl-binding protein [Desulfobacteraceae bacterium]